MRAACSHISGAHKSIAIHRCFTRLFQRINQPSDAKQNNISGGSSILRWESAMPGQQGFDHAGLALQRIGLHFTLALQRPERLGHREHVGSR